MEANNAELAQAENTLKEMDLEEKQLISEHDAKTKKQIIELATIIPELLAAQHKIKKGKEETAQLNVTIKGIDEEMAELNLERLSLEKEMYAAKIKSNSKPTKIAKLNLDIFKTKTCTNTKKTVGFNETIQAISPSSSDSSLPPKVTEFIPYIETPAKKPIQMIKGVKPIKHVPQLIPMNNSERRSNLKLHKQEIMPVKPVIITGIKRDSPLPKLLSEIPTKLPKRLSDPDKLIKTTDNVGATSVTPKKINILENLVIKPPDKKVFVVLPSTSKDSLPDDNLPSTNSEFIQPTTNIRIVSKRKCSPISLKELQKMSPVPIQKIKIVKMIPSSNVISPARQIFVKETIKSPETIVVSSDEMTVADPMDNSLKEVETNSIQSIDLENLSNIDDDLNLNDMDNWDLESNFSGEFFLLINE